MTTPLPLELRLESLAEDHRDGNDAPIDIADDEAARWLDDWWRAVER